jgi:hypothetical protein
LRILFICGCLELGKDGVGDYTRVLAQELVTYGCECSILSLNDSYVTHTIIEEIYNTKISLIRIQALGSAKVRYQIARSYINDFCADIISLQFVPYSFQKKGLPFYLLSFIKAIENKGKLNIMFHELWLDNPARIKDKIYQLIQKKIITKLANSKKEILINVTIEFNKKRLEELNIKSNVIPLFGNILRQLNQKKYLNWSLFEKKKIKVLYFGAHPRDEFRTKLINELYNFCINKHGEIAIVCACGNSDTRHIFINLLKEKLSSLNVHIEDTGHLSVEEIDFLMENCTVGISRSTPYLLGKSGSSIAMLEHGLPLWLPKADKFAIGDLKFYYRKELLFHDLHEIDFSTVVKYPFESQLSLVAKSYFEQFKFYL